MSIKKGADIIAEVGEAVVKCQRLGGEVISGREFYMESIEVE